MYDGYFFSHVKADLVEDRTDLLSLEIRYTRYMVFFSLELEALVAIHFICKKNYKRAMCQIIEELMTHSILTNTILRPNLWTS